MTQIDIAKYKPIPNYSRYLVSEGGEVWDTVQQKTLTPNINGGYKCLNLARDDGRKLLDKVHRLVAYIYLTKPENAANHVVHVDTDRMNNHYTNLRWKIKNIKTEIVTRKRNLWKDGVSRTENKKIYSIWRNILRRCNDPSHPYYHWYGARGVKVDNKWLDYGEFRTWYLENVVEGWQLDKDLIPLARGSKDYIYSENTCCFIPSYINLWFSNINSRPKIRNRNNIFSLSFSETTNGVRSKLYVSSKDIQEVLEKYYDWKDKHIKELLKRMVDESDRKGCRHRLNSEVIELLSNFDMKKILEFT